MGALWRLWALLVVCVGCGLSKGTLPDGGMGAGEGDHGGTSAHPGSMPRTAQDRDGDGLCDSTEQRLGTNPDSADSDGDGLPDFIEALNGFEPSDPGEPAEDQVGKLLAETDATLDFPVRVTVDGDGSTLTGYFDVVGSIYADGSNAGDFAQGTSAVEANPTDAVRRVESGSARFASVLGRSRLSFSLRFEYPSDLDPLTCARAYPFRYGVKKEDGSMLSDRLFLLVTAPRDISQFCIPATCR